MIFLFEIIQDHEFNTLISGLISYNYIIYKSTNKPNRHIFLTVFTYMNTQSGLTYSNKTLSIVPPISPTSTTLPYPTKSDFDNIHTDIKASNNKYHSDMKAMNDQIFERNFHISDILAKLTDTISKIDKQEEKLTNISSEISTYEEHMHQVIINKN